MKQTVTFVHDKETKATQRFSAPANSMIQGSLYLPKELAGALKEITVEISSAEAAAPQA